MNSPFPHPGSSRRDVADGGLLAKSLLTIKSTSVSGVGTKPFTALEVPGQLGVRIGAKEYRNILRGMT
jgi:hypothetical protein